MKIKRADVDVKNEEIVIHPTAISRDGKKWFIDARIIGELEMNGETYEFNKVIEIELEKK